MTYTLYTENKGKCKHFSCKDLIVKHITSEDSRSYISRVELYDGNGILKGDLLQYERVPIFPRDRQNAALDTGAIFSIVPGVSRNYQNLAEVNDSDLELIADWVAKDRTHLGVVSGNPSPCVDLGLIAIMRHKIKEELKTLQNVRRAVA